MLDPHNVAQDNSREVDDIFDEIRTIMRHSRRRADEALRVLGHRHAHLGARVAQHLFHTRGVLARERGELGRFEHTGRDHERPGAGPTCASRSSA